MDTISDALNNSFAMVIQSFIQMVGTLLMLFVLNWRLSLLVVVGYVAMFLLHPATAASAASAYYSQPAGQPGRAGRLH